MKRAIVIAGLLLIGTLALAQRFQSAPQQSTHSVPASAMSLGSGPAANHHFGPPASALSLSPNGLGSVPHFSYRPEPRSEGRFDHDRRRVPVLPVYVPSYYPAYGYYGYGYPYDSSYVAPDPQPQPAADTGSNASAYDSGYQAGVSAERDRTEEVDRAVQRALDARGVTGSSVSVTTGAPREAPPAAPRTEEDQGPATLLIFKNGERRETRNYAIIGQTLIDVGAHSAKRIPLADLDLPATIKANEERGTDFKLPSRG